MPLAKLGRMKDFSTLRRIPVVEKLNIPQNTLWQKKWQIESAITFMHRAFLEKNQIHQ